MPDPTTAERSWQQKIEESLSYIANALERLNEQMTELRRYIETGDDRTPVDLGYDRLDDRPLR